MHVTRLPLNGDRYELAGLQGGRHKRQSKAHAIGGLNVTVLHACSARCTDRPLHPCINVEPVVHNSSSCSPCTVVWHKRTTPTLPHKYSTVSRNTGTSLDPWALLKSLCTCQTPSAALPNSPSPSKAKCLCASGEKRDGALGGHQRPLHARSTGSI